MGVKTKKPMKGVSSTRKKGVEYWSAVVDGRKKYCGKGDDGRKLAEAARAKWLANQYENREVNAGVKTKRMEFKTVKDIADWYMILPAIQEQKSYHRKLIAVTRLLEFFGKKHVAEADPDNQDRYRAARRGQGIADSTINYEMRILQAMYSLALKRKKIPFEMMPGEFIQKGSTLPRRRISDDQYKAILEHSAPDFRDIVVCAYETAMRASEITNLTVEQVYLNVQHISGALVDYIDLGIFDTKNGTRRTVPVSAELKEVLSRRIKGRGKEDFVFTLDGQKTGVQKVDSLLKAVCKAAGVIYGDNPRNKKGERTGIVFHCFRHTRASKWVEMGFSDEIIRRATGHRSLEAYRQYIKLDPYAVMRLVTPGKNEKLKILENSAVNCI